MDIGFEKIYSELRQSRKELEQKLCSDNCSQKIKPFIKEELNDIVDAITKLECGEFGKCEMSGELLPSDVLSMIPTLKTVSDYQSVEKYFRKPIYS